MGVDATKRRSIPHDSDFQNLLSETLTTFLTSILGRRRTSFLEKSREVILYLLDARGNEGYPSQIAAHYGHGRKRYQDIIQPLKKAGFIKVLPKISNYSPILLNDNVRVILNKMVGGLAKSANLPSPALKGQTNLSEFSLPNSDVRDHRILSIYLHNLSFRRFQKLKGTWSHHNSRCVTYEKSDNISDNKLYTVQWYKDKLMVFSPVEFGSIEEFSKVRSKVDQQLGALSQVIARRYRIEIEFENSVNLVKAHATKCEIESKDPLSKAAVRLFKAEGHSYIEFPDFKWCEDYEGLEYIQGYKSGGREGYGPALFNHLLHLPETVHEYHQDYKNGQAQILVQIDRFEEKFEQQRALDLEIENRNIQRSEATVSALQDISVNVSSQNMLIENLIVYLKENVASKDDVERIVEQLQYVNPGKSSRTQEVIELLEGGPKTLQQLAVAMNITKPGVIYYLKQLNVDGSEFIKQPGRGRPTKVWRLKENE